MEIAIAAAVAAALALAWLKLRRPKPEPAPTLCKRCGDKPPDRYYPPDVGLCRDCFRDEIIERGA